MLVSAAFYFVIAIVTSWCVHNMAKKKRKTSNYYFEYALALLIPSIVAGIRYDVGTDFIKTYQPAFNIMQMYPNVDTRFEFLYTFLSKIVIFFYGNISVLMFIMAFLTTLFIIKALLNYRENISISLAMFIYMILLYQSSLNTIRQALSVAIMFYAVKYIYTKDILRFMICVLVAFGFHYSALICIPVYFISPIIMDKKKQKIFMISIVMLILCIINFEKIFLPLIQKFDNLEWYYVYFEVGNGIVLTMGYYLRLLPFVLMIPFTYKEISSNYKIYFMFNMLVIGFAFNLLGYMGTNYTDRLGAYFMISQIVIMPFMYKTCNKKVISKSFLAYFVILWFYEYIYMNAGETVPYQTIFQSII